ncbi:YgaP-like transmembrane domain [Nannocystis bainbridge]|uniref:DUF2892 domain-containing protein n=1 Tax=Nannocystis bainbridge TaxID=2995303 RepID=A0ABT5EBT2_9BACT|nr:YgaP-like transmembrane domain [Nannocystis bainbridge]MDC0723329.1 DUF2892 domain-containing protein [Nannocystis bainbridge]
MRGADTVCAQNVGQSERAASLLAGAWMVAWGLVRARRWPLSLVVALAGGSLMRRGVTGQSMFYRAMQIDTERPGAPYPGVDPGRAVVAEAAVTIDRPVGEVYAFWRHLQNLPQFMADMIRVSRLERGGWSWMAEGPFGRPVEVEVEITQDVEGQRIGWRSREGAVRACEGCVEFHATSSGGTEVWVRLYHEPMAGDLGAWVARLVGRDSQRALCRDLARLKQILEWRSEHVVARGEVSEQAGEEATSPALTQEQRVDEERRASFQDRVDFESDESFPASDPPGRY